MVNCVVDTVGNVRCNSGRHQNPMLNPTVRVVSEAHVAFLGAHIWAPGGRGVTCEPAGHQKPINPKTLRSRAFRTLNFCNFIPHNTVVLNVNPATFFWEFTFRTPHASPQRGRFVLFVPACIPAAGEIFVFQPRTYPRNSYLFIYFPSCTYPRNKTASHKHPSRRQT
jgi:hypothetical protein